MWAAVCSVYLVLLGITYLCCALAWRVSSDGLDHDLGTASAEIEELTRSLGGAEAELADAQQLLDSIRGIAKQPDWSLLLALVAKTLGDEVVLDTCKLGPPNVKRTVVRGQKALNGTAGGTPRNEPPYTLYISGFARSQAAVSRFVLRLDALDLFERVDLLRTSREAMFDGDATGFQVQCSFRWQQQPPQPQQRRTP